MKRWLLNDKQFVQNRTNQRVTYRQFGGGAGANSRYQGITLTSCQFNELDKVIGGTDEGISYRAYDLGGGVFFTHPGDNIYTLRKESRKNANNDIAFFRFDHPSWMHYLKEVHSEVKSLLQSDEQE